MSGQISRGYFAIGVEGLSKPMNFGNLVRSAHAFGASFFFTVGKSVPKHLAPKSDTSRSIIHIPYYHWDFVSEMQLPYDCKLVGIELVDEAVQLPSFGHPQKVAYILGPELGTLSPEMLKICDYVVKIPTSFCINVATAGAIVMYDRVRNLGKFDPRPVTEGLPKESRPVHVQGDTIIRSK